MSIFQTVFTENPGGPVEAILRRTNQLNMEGSLNVGGICLDKNAHYVHIDGKILK